MRVIARPILRDFQLQHHDAAVAIETWYRRALRAKWRSPQDIKAVNRSGDFLQGNCVVFNLGGNNYRLIVRIDYEFQCIVIRFIGTHAEYDKIDASTV